MLALDLNALLASIRDDERGEGLTAAEVAERMGWTLERTRREIKRLIAAGRCRAARKRATAMDGRELLVPSYVFEGVQ